MQSEPPSQPASRPLVETTARATDFAPQPGGREGGGHPAAEAGEAAPPLDAASAAAIADLPVSTDAAAAAVAAAVGLAARHAGAVSPAAHAVPAPAQASYPQVSPGPPSDFSLRPGFRFPDTPLPGFATTAATAAAVSAPFAAVDGATTTHAPPPPPFDTVPPPQPWPRPAASKLAPDRPPLPRRIAAVAARAVRFAVYAAAVYLAVVLVLVGVYRHVDPPMSLLMLTQTLGGTNVTRRWVPLSAISPNLVRAVVVSEDGRFCSHRGVDLGEIKSAIERARDGIPRGASTITMQVVKNLFLSPFNNYVRKAVEIPLALLVDAAWPKWRIFEIYANIAEWGPGIFGAEAAARQHFDKPALRLNEQEAALLAVTLPNPIGRDAGSPGAGTMRLAQRIQLRMRSMPRATACLDAAAAPSRRVLRGE